MSHQTYSCTPPSCLPAFAPRLPYRVPENGIGDLTRFFQDALFLSCGKRQRLRVFCRTSGLRGLGRDCERKMELGDGNIAQHLTKIVQELRLIKC